MVQGAWYFQMKKYWWLEIMTTPPETTFTTTKPTPGELWPIPTLLKVASSGT
jgi:hypothetical protein